MNIYFHIDYKFIYINEFWTKLCIAATVPPEIGAFLVRPMSPPTYMYGALGSTNVGTEEKKKIYTR